jgi:hypothetical protein
MERTLRKELKSQNPTLYSAFERSLEIAMTQWLPNVTQNMDSYNSYPHIIGVEYHLDDILYRENIPSHIIKLNPTEIYILLCSVLFHDIGKAKPKDKNNNNSNSNKQEKQEVNHSIESENLIKSKWAQLGIVSERLAMVIAPICRFHDDNSPVASENLRDVYEIDRYDPIRGRKLGALLKLADNLDDTFSRVVPLFLFNKEFIEEYNKAISEALKNDHNQEYINKHIKENDVLQTVGEFRMKIQSVQVDYETKMIRTVLDLHYFNKVDIYTGSKENIYGKLHEYLDKMIIGEKYSGTIKENCILFTIAKDVYKNNESLKEIRNELYAMHIPLDKWVIECDKHLYHIKWEGENILDEKEKEEAILKAKSDDYKNEKFDSFEIVEPVISYEYCSNVLNGIIRLSGSSFGKTFHTYEKLLRYVREDTANIEKIKCAVKRLAVLLDYVENEKKGEKGIKIYSDNIGWRITGLNTNVLKQTDDCMNEEKADQLFNELDDMLNNILNKKAGKSNEKR